MFVSTPDHKGLSLAQMFDPQVSPELNMAARWTPPPKLTVLYALPTR